MVSLRASEGSWVVGTWASDHDYFAQIRISVQGDRAVAQAYRRCDQGLCFWAKSSLRGFSRVGQDENTQFSAFFEAASARYEMTLYREGSHLVADVAIITFGADGPEDHQAHLVFRRSQAHLRVSPRADQAIISGKPIGPAQGTASLFQVSLYGPDDRERFVRTESLHNGYRFEDLENGTYWIYIQSRGSTGVMVKPERQLITIQEGKPVQQNIELR